MGGTEMRDGGKGDKQRPLGVPKEQFENNWDAIFKKIPTLEELEELRKGALNPNLRTYDGKLK